MTKDVQREVYDDYSDLELITHRDWSHITGDDVGDIVKQVHEIAVASGGYIFSTPRVSVHDPSEIRTAPETDFVVDPTCFVPDIIDFKTSYRNPMVKRHPAVVRYEMDVSPPTAELYAATLDELTTILTEAEAKNILDSVYAGDVDELHQFASSIPFMDMQVDLGDKQITLPTVMFILLASRPPECPEQSLVSLLIEIDADKL